MRASLIAAAIVAFFAAEARAQEACVAWAAVDEPDVARNRAELQASDVCLTIERLEEGGRNWTLQVLTSARPGPLWVVPHDDEKGPFESGVHGVTIYGGVMIAVEAGEERNLDGQDPNGAFGAGPNCEKLMAPAPRYTQAFARRARGRPIVALHANGAGYSGPGTVSIANPDELETAFRARPFPGAVSAADTFIYVAGLTARPSNALRSQIAWLNRKRISVMYEHVTAASNDCSLSNFAALHPLGPYFNIEVVDEDVATQKRMLALLMQMLAP